MLEEDLLRVAAVGDGLVLVVWQGDVAELLVGDVLDKYPPHLKDAFPDVLRPHRARRVVVHGREHLRHALEVARAVDREEEVDGPLARRLLEGRVEARVALLGAGPDRKLDRLVDVVLTKRLDHEKAGKLGLGGERLCFIYLFIYIEICKEKKRPWD